MINLYQILHLSPYASEKEIRNALKEMETALNHATIQAVHEWLLVDSVRAKYDMKLRTHYPEYFLQHQNQPRPIARPSHNKKYVIVQKSLDADLPLLWNPRAACNWSLLFNVAFGGILHAQNWAALGEKKLANQNYFWAGISVALSVYMIVFNHKIFAFFQFLLLISWYFTLGKKQMLLIEKTHQHQYAKRGWLQPLFLALTGFALLHILGKLFGAS